MEMAEDYISSNIYLNFNRNIYSSDCHYPSFTRFTRHFIYFVINKRIVYTVLLNV